MTATSTALAGALTSSAAATSESGDLAIHTTNLSRRFGPELAVDNINLQVRPGSIYGLIGVNGAGKTTTIRMLMGLLPPTSGAAFLRGVDVQKERWKSRVGVGYVPDRCIVHPWMRVSEAIAFCRDLQPTWNDSRCTELIARFKLEPAKKVCALSKGTAAKLSLLLALAHDPAVLILDEPTDGLDPLAKDDFLEGVLGAACEHGRTVLMSSHNLADLERIADDIGFIHRGKLALQSPTRDLLASTRRLRFVMDAEAPTPALPLGALRSHRQGREWIFTAHDLDPEAIARLAHCSHISLLAEEPLSLHEVFKEFVQGMEPQP